MNRVYVFIDWWNFVLDWQGLTGRGVRIDWKLLPKVAVQKVCEITGANAEYSGTNVYASVSQQSSDTGLSKFLNTLRSFEGYTVETFVRKSRQKPVRCSNCGEEIKECPSCSRPYTNSVEKGVDTALVTEMIRMAVDDVYDTAILGSTDADLCGAVKFTQSRYGKKIYHLSYPNLGVELRNSCWTHIDMVSIKDDIIYCPK